MAYRYPERNQQLLFPPSLDQYIAPDDPVRAYDAFVEVLDFDQLGIDINPDRVGNSRYDPVTMLKLLVYGYSYGIRSSRKLERALHHNVSFVWLMGNLKPDHKTIAEFRRTHKSALTKVLKQCARLCVELGLIEGNTLFVDGSKVRANASINNNWTDQRCLNRLEKIDDRIAAILSECEAMDQSEQDNASLVQMRKELSDNATLKSKVMDILKKLDSEGKKSINTTDQECTNIHGRQGSHAGYNVQSVVDQKHGFIVSSDVTNENNDLHQFAKQIDLANETMEKKCQTACADAGYSNVDELEKIAEQDIKVIVPSAKQASDKEPGPFDKSKFEYHSAQDTYTCPEGTVLTYSHTDEEKQHKVYRIGGSTCRECAHFGVCTKSVRGRTINRLVKEELKQKLERQYEQSASLEVYRLRKQKVELPFGHIKYNLGVGGFLLRGLDGVKAETSILTSCFNISRMITIIGVSGLIAKLAS